MFGFVQMPVGDPHEHEHVSAGELGVECPSNASLE
jgi:hypothetical protein